MVTRIVSGIVLTIIITGSVVLGAVPFGILLMIFSLIGVYELAGAVEIRDKGQILNGVTSVMYLATILIYIVGFLSSMESIDRNVTAVIIGMVLLQLGVFVFTYPKYHTTKITSAIFIVLYAPLMLSFGYRIEAFSKYPFITTALIFVVACISDISAYFVGINFGKHKLAPVLSPKKSIEGAVGAIVCTALMCGVYELCLRKAGLLPAGNFIKFVIMGGVGSVISQIGDLAASAIKRNFNIKDYGNLIPGHGGIMDRVDSWIMVMPIIYMVITCFE